MANHDNISTGPRTLTPKSSGPSSKYTRPSPNSPRTSHSDAPSTRLGFNGNNSDGLQSTSNSSPVAFPAVPKMTPPATNGTVVNDIKWAITSPRKTAKSIARGVSSLTWLNVKQTLDQAKDSATEGLSARINQAFDGHDAVRIGNRVADFIPSVSLPTMHQLSHKVDALTEAIQALMERHPPNTCAYDHESEGMHWHFARSMGAKARRELVKQAICQDWQVVPSQGNMEWQLDLNQRLSDLFRDTEDGRAKLLGMEPLWFPVPARKAYRLVIDTGVVDVEPCGEDFVETPIRLLTGFQLEEKDARVSVADYSRGTQSIEDEWEMVE